jgi:hypothetical protein
MQYFPFFKLDYLRRPGRFRYRRALFYVIMISGYRLVAGSRTTLLENCRKGGGNSEFYACIQAKNWYNKNSTAQHSTAQQSIIGAQLRVQGLLVLQIPLKKHDVFHVAGSLKGGKELLCGRFRPYGMALEEEFDKRRRIL